MNMKYCPNKFYILELLNSMIGLTAPIELPSIRRLSHSGRKMEALILQFTVFFREVIDYLGHSFQITKRM